LNGAEVGAHGSGWIAPSGKIKTSSRQQSFVACRRVTGSINLRRTAAIIPRSSISPNRTSSQLGKKEERGRKGSAHPKRIDPRAAKQPQRKVYVLGLRGMLTERRIDVHVWSTEENR
jgi:hypothetical protein